VPIVVGKRRANWKSVEVELEDSVTGKVHVWRETRVLVERMDSRMNRSLKWVAVSGVLVR
jgi:hypothetical protein